MRRQWTSRIVTAATGATLAVLTTGCLSTGRLADRLFDQGHYGAAEHAYLELLETESARKAKKERALYRLGLIYALPTSGRYDAEKAREHLELLLELDPPSSYALQASLVLALQKQTSELRESVARENEKAKALLAELERLRDQTARVATEATDRQREARRLAAAITALREEISRLSTELTAREQELERIKQIDLEGPP